MNAKTLSLASLLSSIGLIIWNYYANTGALYGKTIGEISDKYDTLFTPAGYAFSIWGIIFIGLLVLSVYMIYCAFSESQDEEWVVKSSTNFIAANLYNALWVWAWLNQQMLLSVVVMIMILYHLIRMVIKLRMELWDAPTKFIAAVWWPIDLYVGWISVALVANLSAYLVFTGWDGYGLSDVLWTQIIIAVVTLLSIFMVIKRNMREFAGVAIWALIAIAVRHSNEIPEIQWTAIAAVIVLGVLNSIHAFQNRATLPFVRRN